MEVISMHATKTNLSKFLEKALHGQEVVFGRNKKPEGKIVAYQEKRKVKKTRRFSGAEWKGKVWFAPDYDQADAEIQKMFDDALENDWKE